MEISETLSGGAGRSGEEEWGGVGRVRSNAGGWDGVEMSGVDGEDWGGERGVRGSEEQ